MNPGQGYARGQMAKAFVTALSHEDAKTRRRADERVARWHKVLDGMADGTLSVGSRTPVAGLPVWVTPEVVRGGFATGEPAAGGPLLDDERAAAERAGVPAARAELFRHYMTDEGLAELYRLLDEGYEIDLPEEGVLLVVAWLLRAGDRLAALTLLDAVEPFAGRLRFGPRPSRRPPLDPGMVSRETAGEVRADLANRRPKAAIDTMNEALTVWNPFADDLLSHWLDTVEDGRVGVREPVGWRERGAGLLARYERLAAEHTLCGKHRRPRENLAILRAALEDAVAGREVRRRGLLQHAVDSMIARRGAPGSASHAELRGRQAEEAARPTHHQLAQVLVARVGDHPANAGLPEIAPLLGPVTAEEAARTGVAAGSEMPEVLRRIVGRALSAPVATLVERGVVPSAEVLAELVPQLVAAASAEPYRDAGLRRLMAAVYRAFRNRRSLLLLNLQHQVRVTELPWVAAVRPYREVDDAARTAARTVLVQLAELSVQAFPATILPNPLVRELDTLARDAGLDVPLVEELAADIFMGMFSGKFLSAAKLAAKVLHRSLYERYYGVDYAAIAKIDDRARRRAGLRVRVSRDFAAICAERAEQAERADARGTARRSPVAANGMVIEQAQILTTHNLAALVHPIGVQPAGSWEDLARRAFLTMCVLVARVEGNRRPLGMVKDAAYAWRQAIFFLSLTGVDGQRNFLVWAEEELERQRGHVAARLGPVLGGLRHVVAGGSLDDGSAPREARRFTGWSTAGHWMVRTGQ